MTIYPFNLCELHRIYSSIATHGACELFFKKGGGLGYVIERGVSLRKGNFDERVSNDTKKNESSPAIDMVRLLGRTPRSSKEQNENLIRKETSESDAVDGTKSTTGQNESVKKSNPWQGSGLGAEWDERVGAGAAASSIVSSIFLKNTAIAETICFVRHFWS